MTSRAQLKEEIAWRRGFASGTAAASAAVLLTCAAVVLIVVPLLAACPACERADGARLLLEVGPGQIDCDRSIWVVRPMTDGR